MAGIKNYILSVTAAAIISGIAVSITGKKTTISTVTRLICGLFITITVISPLAKLRLDNLSLYFSDFTLEAKAVASQGETIALRETSAIIKEQLEAYILDKASSLDLDVQVSVEMSGTQPLVPESVTINGTVAPYGRQRLEHILLNDLEIAKENQLWE